MTARQVRFFQFAESNLLRIGEIDSPQLKVHRKILYVAFIDSISGLVYPSVNSNRERFTEFVVRFGSWPHATRINTPHLARALTLNPDPAYNTVRTLVLENFRSWPQGDLIHLDRDLEAGVVGTHWPIGKRLEEPVEGAAWQHLKHVELLYAYRNALVHGFRPLGHDAELPDDTEPYYLHTSDLGSPDHEDSLQYWELIYPTAFLAALAERVLQGAKKHICDSGIDPVAVLRGGKYWLKELNQ